MPQFRYRGVTQTGALVVGDVKASSREQVPQRIECLGHWPIEVVPQFEPVFRDLGIQPNAGAALVLAASDWLHHNKELSLETVLIATLGGWLIVKRRRVRAQLLAALGTVPGFAGPMRDRRTARIVGTLGLVENGVTLPNAVKILRNVETEPRYVPVVDRVHDQVRSGRRFVDALVDADPVPAIAVRMPGVGDETGDLPSIAKQAARFYEHRFGMGLDRLTGAIGPARIIIVSMVLGSLILSSMSALLSITEPAL